MPLNLLNISLKDYSDLQYTGTIQIGSSGIPVDVLFDTGSSDVFIMSHHLCEDCNKSYANYNETDSTTYTNGDQYDSINYGSGTVKGIISKDVLQVSLTSPNFDQTFLLVTEQVGMNYLCAGGLVGLGFARLQEHPTTLFIDNLKKNGIIEDRKFLFEINGREQPSRLIFGSKNIKEYLKDYYKKFVGFKLSLYDNNDINNYDYTYWSIALDSINMGGSHLDMSYDVILDSGTSLTYLDTYVFRMVLTQLKSVTTCWYEHVQLQCSCSDAQFNAISDIRLHFESQTMVFSKQYFLERKGATCVLLIEPSFGMMILGDSFLRGFWVMFDYEEKMVWLTPRRFSQIQYENSVWVTVSFIFLIIVFVLMCIRWGYKTARKLCYRGQPLQSQILIEQTSNDS